MPPLLVPGPWVRVRARESSVDGAGPGTRLRSAPVSAITHVGRGKEAAAVSPERLDVGPARPGLAERGEERRFKEGEGRIWGMR